MRYVAGELLHGQHQRVGRARSLAIKIRDSVAFVTGANRGLGLVFAQELLAADAKKVYSVAQNPESIMESACAVAVAPPRCPCNSRDSERFRSFIDPRIRRSIEVHC
jgi:hypothetical protein